MEGERRKRAPTFTGPSVEANKEVSVLRGRAQCRVFVDENAAVTQCRVFVDENAAVSADAQKQRQNATPHAHKEITVADVTQQIAKLDRQKKYLFHPDDKIMEGWDLIIIAALLFTALVTPYEVALLPVTIGEGWLFWTNVFLFVLFLTDMVVQFHLIYIDKDGRQIRNLKKIRGQYLRSWFFIDFLTVLPYDFAELFAPDGFVQVLKTIRICRLLKLLRLLRASRIFTRYEKEFGVQRRTQTLIKLLLTIVLVVHLFACLWITVASLRDADSFTWISSWLDSLDSTSINTLCTSGTSEEKINGWYRQLGSQTPSACVRPITVYIASLHWSTVTVTSIGYGDIIPTNEAEYVLCVLLMLCASILWASVVAGICKIVVADDDVQGEFYASNDSLNRYMNSTAVSQEVKKEVRTYVSKSRQSLERQHEKGIIRKLSPFLAGELLKSQKWIEEGKVLWTKHVGKELMGKLVVGMSCSTHAGGEEIPASGRMYVLKSGTCFTETLIMTSSKKTAWNDDFFLSNSKLRRDITARSITYVQLEFLDRVFFWEVFNSTRGTSEHRSMKIGMSKIALIRGLQFMKNHDGMLPEEWKRHKEMQVQLKSISDAVTNLVERSSFSSISSSFIGASSRARASFMSQKRDSETGSNGGLLDPVSGKVLEMLSCQSSMLERIEGRLSRLESERSTDQAITNLLADSC